MLPIRLGGFGLTNTSVIRHAAFVGSFAQSLKGMCSISSTCGHPLSAVFNTLESKNNLIPNLCAFTDAYDLCINEVAKGIKDTAAIKGFISNHQTSLPCDFTEELQSDKESVIPTLSAMKFKSFFNLQKQISKLIHISTLADFLSDDTVSKDSKVRVLSCSGTAAGSFLTAIPSSPDLSLNTLEFTTICLYRLGLCLPLQNTLSDFQCQCGNIHESFTSLCNCHYNGSKFAYHRHNVVRNSLAKILKKDCNFVIDLEPMAFDQNFDSTRKRNDIKVYNFPEYDQKGNIISRGEVHIDVSVTNPLSLSYTSKSIKRGSAVKTRENKKINGPAAVSIKYPDSFVPAVFDSFGLMGPHFYKFIQNLSSNTVYTSIGDYSLSKVEFTLAKNAYQQQFTQKLSIALCRGQSAFLNGIISHVRSKFLSIFQDKPDKSLYKTLKIIGSQERFSSSLSQFSL